MPRLGAPDAAVVESASLFQIWIPLMRNVVIGSLVVFFTTAAFAEYSETWVSPGELKSLEAGHKSARAKTALVTGSKQQASSSRSQGRPSNQPPSDPIAAFARDDRGAHEQRKSRPASARPHKPTAVQQKVRREDVGESHRSKAVTASMV